MFESWKRREGEERQGGRKESALTLRSISLGIQRLKLNPAIKFIALESQAGENSLGGIKRTVQASKVQGLVPGAEEGEGGVCILSTPPPGGDSGPQSPRIPAKSVWWTLA